MFKPLGTSLHKFLSVGVYLLLGHSLNLLGDFRAYLPISISKMTSVLMFEISSLKWIIFQYAGFSLCPLLQ